MLSIGGALVELVLVMKMPRRLQMTRAIFESATVAHDSASQGQTVRREAEAELNLNCLQ